MMLAENALLEKTSISTSFSISVVTSSLFKLNVLMRLKLGLPRESKNYRKKTKFALIFNFKFFLLAHLLTHICVILYQLIKD